jgi:hypothetical protein
MLRWMYIQLLWMHPPAFRSRFGDEMLADFDESTRRAPLLLDAVASLGRQWLLRPASHLPVSVNGAAPMFQLIETPPLRRSLLLRGAVISTLAFLGLVFAIGHAGRPGKLAFGAHRWRAGLFPMERVSLDEAGVTTEVRLGPDADSADHKLWVRYFRSILALRALDANGDAALDVFEIAAAPGALSTLDRDRDGRLTPEEAGFHGASADPGVIDRRRMAFMSAHPVLAALDADRSGDLSSGEITGSAAALRGLDRNGDGALSPFEVGPDWSKIR